MSNIVVILKGPEIEASMLLELHKILNVSILRIRGAVSEGAPIIEMEIFDNHYEEKSRLLRRLIDLIRRRGIDSEVYELPEGDVFKDTNKLNESLISLDVLEGILDSSDQELDRQLDR